MSGIAALDGRRSMEMARLRTQTAALLTLTHTFIGFTDPVRKKSPKLCQINLNQQKTSGKKVR